MITTTTTTKKPFEKKRIEDLFISKGGYSDYAFRGILKEEEKENRVMICRFFIGPSTLL